MTVHGVDLARQYTVHDREIHESLSLEEIVGPIFDPSPTLDLVGRPRTPPENRAGARILSQKSRLRTAQDLPPPDDKPIGAAANGCRRKARRVGKECVRPFRTRGS